MTTLDDDTDACNQPVVAHRLIAHAFHRADFPVGWRVVLVRVPSDAWSDSVSEPLAMLLGHDCSIILATSRRWSAAQLVQQLRDGPLVIVGADFSQFCEPDIIAAADVVIDASDMSSVIPGVPAEIARRATPIQCELAERLRQTPEEYAARLTAIVGKTDVKTANALTLDSLNGDAAAIAWGRSLCRDLADYRDGRIGWADVDRGALLVGPPGCGKTTFAAALAASAGCAFIATSFARWDSKQGQGNLSDLQKAMRQTFADARASAPCIVFIDEIDSIPGRQRAGDGAHDGYWRAVTTCLLECLDGIGGREGVVVLGATNDASQLDDALLRSGRLDRTITMSLPGADALAGIYRHHIGGVDGVDVSLAARLTVGLSPADVERLCRQARRRARDERRPVRTDDLLSEIVGGDLWTAASGPH